MDDRRIAEMLRNVLDAILARSARDPGYGFIDTKLNVATGRDFGENDPWYTQKGVIYPWIQGRGLEALAGHLLHLRDLHAATPARKAAIIALLRSTVRNLERLRRKNHGRLFFLMDKTGGFLQLGPDGEAQPAGPPPAGANYSDLFCSKGLWMAGIALGDAKLALRGERYFSRVVRAILNDRFVTDQQAFDPKNPVKAEPGKHPQGPLMIALSGTAIGLQYGDALCWERTALRLLRRILQRHFDPATLRFWEAVGDDGKPWLDGGKLLSDPGHNFELIGLSLKNLMRFRTRPGLRFARQCKAFYPEFLRAAYRRGYAAAPGGIVKSVDLLTGRVFNSDMPWWSLPEGIRAALLCEKFTGDTSLHAIADEFAGVFLHRYVRPERHDMAIQTRDAAGHDVAVIPATPDADPGYHTGLALLDVLRML